jgi:hypothetical protein
VPAGRDPRAARFYPTGQAQEVTAVNKAKPQVTGDEEHERVHERVAAAGVAKDTGMVCTRLPHPSRPGARQSTVWTVRARMAAIDALGRRLVRDGVASGVGAPVPGGRPSAVSTTETSSHSSTFAMADLR